MAHRQEADVDLAHKIPVVVFKQQWLHHQAHRLGMWRAGTIPVALEARPRHRLRDVQASELHIAGAEHHRLGLQCPTGTLLHARQVAHRIGRL